MDLNAPRQGIPDSVLPYPKGIYNRSKYVFWKIITPFHNYWRDTLLSLGFLKHDRRQNFAIGTLAPGRSVEDFLKYLEVHGYGNHFIAWKDRDEIISVRKLVDFETQYHLRIFSDGEIRGHYEYTPECHPRWHMKEVGQTPYHEHYLDELGDWVVRATPASALFTPAISSRVSVGASVAPRKN
jgi:hypothetical protein